MREGADVMIPAQAVAAAERRDVRSRWAGMLNSRIFRSLVGLALAAVCMAVLLSRTDLGQIASSVQGIRLPLLALAVGLRLATLPILSLRWHTLIRRSGSPGPVRLIPAVAIGQFGGAVLPFGLGAVMRAQYLHSQSGVAVASALSSVGLESLMDVAILVFFYVPILVTIGSYGSLGWATPAAAIGGVLLVLLLVLSGRRLPTILRRHVSGAGVPLRRLVDLVESQCRATRDGFLAAQSIRGLTFALLVTLLARLMTVGVHLLVGMAFGLDLNWTAYLIVAAAVNTPAFLPFSQGNVGPYELVAVATLSGLGTGRATATAYALVAHAVLVMPMVAAGLLFLGWHLIMVARKRSLSPPERRPGSAAQAARLPSRG